MECLCPSLPKSKFQNRTKKSSLKNKRWSNQENRVVIHLMYKNMKMRQTTVNSSLRSKLIKKKKKMC